MIIGGGLLRQGFQRERKSAGGGIEQVGSSRRHQGSSRMRKGGRGVLALLLFQRVDNRPSGVLMLPEKGDIAREEQQVIGARQPGRAEFGNPRGLAVKESLQRCGSGVPPQYLVRVFAIHWLLLDPLPKRSGAPDGASPAIRKNRHLRQ